MELNVNLINTKAKAKAKEFLELIDKAEDLIGKAEQIGWQLIRSCRDSKDENNNPIELLGWCMQSIASEINHYIGNDAGTYEDWETIQNEADK